MEDMGLIWRLRRGDRDALGRVYAKYKDYLLKLAAGLTGELPVAEDIVHDVFVTLAQSAHRLRLFGNFKSYLATCVVNRVRNHYRARERQRTESGADMESLIPDTRTPGGWIVGSEELRTINEALAKLPYEQREAILLHLHGEMRFREIGRLCNVSANTIRSRYRYGLGKLRQLLDSEATP